MSCPCPGTVSFSLALVGHSERRRYFGETDETVNKRLKAALVGRDHTVIADVPYRREH